MNPAEVIVHEVKGERVIQVLNFLAKGVCQSSHSPHGHADGQVVALGVASGDVLRVGVAVYDFLPCADAGRWTVSHFVLRRIAVQLNKHRVVNLGPESILDRCQVGFVSVRRELDLVGEPSAQIADKLEGITGVALAHQEGRDELGVGVRGDPSPHVAVAELPSVFVRDVLLLRVAEVPYLVALDTLAGEVAENPVLILGADSPDLRHELQDRIEGHVAHAGSGADGGALHQGVYDLDSLLSIQLVHDCNICLSGQEVKGEAEKSLAGRLEIA